MNIPRVLLAIPFVTIVLWTGCSESTTEPRPATERIVGSITSAGEPVTGWVEARSVRESPDGPEVNVKANTDSMGGFSLTVPPARYVLRFAADNPQSRTHGYAYQGTLSQSRADTIDVQEGSAPHRVDVALGTLRLELSAPQLEGRPIAVILSSEEERYFSYRSGTVSGGNLEIIARGLPADRYRVSLMLAFESWIWLDWTYEQSEARWITVGLDAETVVEETAPPRGMLRGTVHGSWEQLGLSPPHLEFFGLDTTSVSFNPADSLGNFALWIFAPVRGKVRISLGGVRRWFGGNNFAEATEFFLEPGRSSEIEVIESGIAGVMNQDAGYAYPDIEIVDATGRSIGESYPSGHRGYFRFANLVPGSYYLHFDGGPTWIPQWYGGSEGLEDAVPIEVSEEGEVVWVEVQLDDGGSLAGQVLDPSGAPLAGVATFLVAADSEPGDSTRRDISAGSEGTFRLDVLPDGSYKLGAQSQRYGQVWYPGVASWDSAAVITLAGHPDLTGTTLRFP